MKRGSCSFPGCGRPVRAVGLCQTHWKQHKKGKELRPVRRKQPPRMGTRRLSGLSLSALCAAEIEREAKESNATLTATITDIIEAWARSTLARSRGPEGTH
jgi:hypothetical protein